MTWSRLAEEHVFMQNSDFMQNVKSCLNILDECCICIFWALIDTLSAAIVKEMFTHVQEDGLSHY